MHRRLWVAAHRIATDELPHIHGTVSDIARQSADQKLSTSGVFSAPAFVEGVTFGTNFTANQGDGFILDFGKDVPHENLPPCTAAYVWCRTA